MFPAWIFKFMYNRSAYGCAYVGVIQKFILRIIYHTLLHHQNVSNKLEYRQSVGAA